MGNRQIVTIVTLFIVLGLGACNKRLVPGLKPGKDGKTYDEASYNYVYVEAVKLKLLGNLGDALKYFEQSLTINPASDAAYYQMAQIVLNTGDIENGKKYLVKANSLQPGNIWYNMLLANIYYQQKNIDSTIICYERAVRFYPEKENLQISLANLYTENKKYEKAKNILNRFDEKYGVNENTTLSLINNLVAEEKYKEALVKVQQLLAQKPDEISYNGLLAEIYSRDGDNEKAAEVYNQLIERNPDNPQIQLSLCDFLLAKKSYNELFTFLNKVILNEKIQKEEKITFLGGLIENSVIQKDYGLKMELALKILEANYAGDDIMILMFPEFLQKENKLIEAGIRLEEIIKAKPDNYFAWEKLLLVYYEVKDFKNLQARGEECATKFNKSILAKILYANGAMENKEFQVALEELRKADILAGDNKDQKLQVVTMKADIYYRMKDFGKAFDSYDEALKLNDTNNIILNNYAYYLAEQNMKLKEAEKMAKEVIEKEKNNTTFLDTYAWVLYKRGKTKEASHIMQKVLDSGEKDDAEWYEHYGFILKKLGKCREAIQKWEKALAIDKSKIHLIKEIENCRK